MTERYNLPLLPGLPVSPSKNNFKKSQGLVFKNGLPDVGATRSGSAGTHPMSSRAATARLSGNASVPAYIAHDKQSLLFHAYFMEAVHERPGEQHRVRKVSIYFYLEDGTLQIAERRVENSGIMQGNLLKRHRVPKPPPHDDECFDLDELNVGESVTIYGRTYRIVDCDPFTRKFMTKNGYNVPPKEEYPYDPFEEATKIKKESVQPRKPMERVDNSKQFYENDRKVLRFYCLWDDSESEYGEERYFIMHYFLADDTIEVREQTGPNSGRDGPSIFLKRQKLIKDSKKLVKAMGDTARRTVLNTHGHTNNNKHMLDNLRTGSVADDYYTDADIRIGSTIYVYGRPFLVCDCDGFTREHYEEKFGETNMDPIDISKPAPADFHAAPPPHTGFGSEDDSLASVRSLRPERPRKAKGRLADTVVDNNTALRFAARLVPDSAEREFVISFFVADDTLTVHEQPKRNGGFKGGKFLERRKVKAVSRLDTNGYIDAEDLCVGNHVVINDHTFEIIQADDFALKFMEDKKLPQSDVDAIAQRIKSCEVADEVAALLHDAGVCPPEQVKDILNGVVTEHEMITLTRAFAEQNTVSQNPSQRPATVYENFHAEELATLLQQA